MGFDFGDVWQGLLNLVGPSEVISIDKLLEWVSELDTDSNAGNLKGIAFDKTANDRLGLTGTKDDFTVNIPWGSWKQEKQKSFPSQLQQGIFDVLKAGQTDTEQPFMDLASLVPHEEFFTESSDGKSVAQSIADWVNHYDFEKTAPVVRFLVGDDAAKDRETSFKRSPFTNIFWPLKDGKRVRLIKHPKARIYVGYFNPNFRLKSADDKVTIFIRQMIKSVAQLNPLFSSYVKEADVNDLVNFLVTKGVRTVSWNHGKVLAINGKVVMTGGGNYWNEYKNKHPSDAKKEEDRMDHDIVDTQAKVVGDAAVSAHKWADYFWAYLRDPPTTDETSTWWGASLSDDTPEGPAWFAGHAKSSEDPKRSVQPPIKDQEKLPLQVQKSPAKVSVQGSASKINVLTVAKIGDWRGPALEINYPVLIIDSVRDLLLNIYWQKFAESGDGLFGIGAQIWGVNKALSDYTLNKTLFSDYKVNPTAWASRYTKTWAIAYAQSSVIICQQMLVQNLQANDKEYQGLVSKVNTKLELAKSTQSWDGHIWPFDIFIAIAQAIGAISKSKEPKTKENWKGVYIILTTKHAGRRATWEDQTSIDRIKFRIRRIMRGLPSQAGGIPENKIDQAISDHLHFKRVIGDDGKVFHHSKIVCVDRKLMYVGSDNVYPCYNQEHGIWVEDREAIDKWLKSYLNDFWAKCADPVTEKSFAN